MRNHALVFFMLIGAAASAAADSSLSQITVTGWASPGDVMTYTQDGVPLKLEATSALGTVAGKHQWNRSYEIVQIDGTRWVERTALKVALCGATAMNERMPGGSTTRTRASTGYGSGEPCTSH